MTASTKAAAMRQNTITVLVCVAVFCAAPLVRVQPAPQKAVQKIASPQLPMYVVEDLGSLPANGSATTSFGTAINNSGQVAGQMSTGKGQLHLFCTSAWRTAAKPEITDLGAPGDHTYLAIRTASGINDAGEVTGQMPVGGAAHVFRSSGNTAAKKVSITDLGTGSQTWGEGHGINASGQITGTLSKASFRCAFRTGASNTEAGQTLTLLKTLGGTNGESHAINDGGQVTGAADVPGDGATHAFRTTDTNAAEITDLGTLGGTNSVGLAINASGQVVGHADTRDGRDRAFRTNGNGARRVEMTDLGSLNHYRDEARAINRAGETVGISYASSGLSTAFYVGPTPSSKMIDLNGRLDATSKNWKLNEANGINERGQITGTGFHNHLVRAFLLTPIVRKP